MTVMEMKLMSIFLQYLSALVLLIGCKAKRDRILWILSENGVKMERSKLRVRAGMRYALLDPILDELKKEGIWYP
jgi:hypothetical protein